MKECIMLKAHWYTHVALYSALITSMAHSAHAETPVEMIEGKISEVTLYQGTALVSRSITLNNTSGMTEVIVTSLPSTTDGSSVYADQAEGVQIRSVAFRSRPPTSADSVEPQVAELDTQIQTLKRVISEKKNHIALYRIRQDLLKSLQNFSTPASNIELKRGLLDADQLKKLTLMYFELYEEASQKILEIDFEIQDKKRDLTQLLTQRNNLAQTPLMRYDAIILLEKIGDTKKSFRLNYLVKDCGWSPVYNVRGQSDGTPTLIEFNALIHQVSGEDWDKAKLHLSTASPQTSAFNPILSPLYIQVTSIQEQTNRVQSMQRRRRNSTVRNSYNFALQNRKKAMIGQFKSQSFEEMANANFDANAFAANVQLFEFSQQVNDLRNMQDEISGDDLNIQYDLTDPVTLPSRREGQIIPVFKSEIPTSYYRVATPVLTSSVFREAELINHTDQDLLGGQVNVYLDQAFTGKTNIPTIARGRKFTLGFGVDGQVRTQRALRDRVESVQGGNKQITLSYEVMIDNYHNMPIRLFLKDRTPYMDDRSKLRVNLTKTSAPLSTDAQYQRFDKSKGILLWDLNVIPGDGEKATMLEYTYLIEFEKSYGIQEIEREQKRTLRGQFLMDSKRRMKKRK